MMLGKIKSTQTSPDELAIVDLEIASDESDDAEPEEVQANIMNTLTVDESLVVDDTTINIKLDRFTNKEEDEKYGAIKLVFHKQMRTVSFVSVFMLLLTFIILSLKDSNKLWIIFGLKEAIAYVILVTWVNKSENLKAFAIRKLSNWKVSSEI